MKRSKQNVQSVAQRGFMLILIFTIFTLTGQANAQTCVQPPTGLVSWWPGDGNANDIQDGNPGTLQGGATFGAAKVGQGFTFSGTTGERVVVPHAANLNLESLPQATFLGWFKSTAGIPVPFDSDTDKIIVAKHTSGFNNGWFFTTAQGCFFGDIGAGMGNAGINLNDGEFHHFACVKDNTTYRQYIDGVLVITTNGPTFGTPNAESVQMGGITSGTNNNFGQLNGVVDEIQVFQNALTTAEVQAIYSSGSAGLCKPATIEGTLALISELLASGDIDNAGLAGSLSSQLRNALAAANSGDIQTADSILNAFINHVTAQSGKHISAEAAAILINAATYIINH
ncbi:MAG TPA: LamG-like jellyroll fold domain-containing protein [Thermodesulfovibrionales bacterium]|nr:LamG-like jellyroll fold domain-containing protein [Thermodesulfovibrionales bacterium]